MSDRFYICRHVTYNKCNYLKRNYNTERIHFKGPLKISHQVPCDTCMQIQEEAILRSSGYDMKQIMKNTSNLSDFYIEVMKTDKDHIHMTICSEPKLSPVQTVSRLKTNINNYHWGEA